MTFRHNSDDKEHMRAAAEALVNGEYVEAYEHIAKVDPHGTYGMAAAKFREEIAESEAADIRDSARAPWYGFAVAAVLYLIMYIKPPSAWTIPVWAALALIVIPLIAGYATAYFYGFRCDRMERFWVSAKPVGFAMAGYSIIGIMAAFHKIALSPDPDAGGHFMAGFLATIVYAAIAFAIAGCSGAIRPYTTDGSIDDYSEYFEGPSPSHL